MKIKSIKNSLLLATVLLYYSNNLFSQVNLLLNIQTNDYSLSTTDTWTLNLINTTPNTYKCYLRATVTVPNEGVIGEGNSKSFVLQPFQNKLINKTSTDLADSSNVSYSIYYVGAYIKTGELPSREYTVCIELFSIADGTLLGKTCTDVQLQKYQPPVNIFPFNGDTVDATSLNFQWLQSQPSNINMKYAIRIAEMLSIQSKTSALFSNNYYYTQEGIPSTIFQYPVNARELEPGQMYSWVIEAQINELVLKSEPTFFIVSKSNKPTGKKPKEPNIYSQFIDLRSPEISRLYTATGDELNLLLHNRYSSHEISVHVVNSKQEVLLKDKLQVHSGLNKLSFSIAKMKTSPSEIYYLKLSGYDKSLPVVKFKVIKPQSKK